MLGRFLGQRINFRKVKLLIFFIYHSYTYIEDEAPHCCLFKLKFVQINFCIIKRSYAYWTRFLFCTCCVQHQFFQSFYASSRIFKGYFTIFT